MAAAATLPGKAEYSGFTREKQRNSVIYGLLAGVGFALGAWGLDALLLAQASGDLYWLKLALGLPLSMLIGALAGYITGRVDNSLVAVAVWLLAGIGFAFVASHVPFEGLSFLVGLFVPAFAGKPIYPFVYSAEVRMNLLYVVVGAASALGGLIQLFLVESATRASWSVTRWLTLGLCMPIFAIGGLVADYLITQPLRIPVTVVDELIQQGIQAQTVPVSKDEARQLRLSSLRPLADVLHQPRALMVGEYDPISFDEVSVIVRFEDAWARCWVINKTPGFCQRLEPFYLKKLACLLDDKDQFCNIKLNSTAQEQLPALVEAYGPATSASFIGQYGVTAQAQIDQASQSSTCTFLSTGSVYLDNCQLTAPDVPLATYNTPLPSSTLLPATGTAQPQPTQAEAPQFQNPTFSADLPILPSAPVYTITVDVDFDQKRFEGQQRIAYTNNETVPLTELYFRLLPNARGSYGNGSLQVQDVSVNQQVVETELSVMDTVLKTVLPAPLLPGEQALVSMSFSGEVPVDFGGEETPAGYGIYNFSENVLSLAGWYPMLAVYDQQGWHLDAPSELGDSVFADSAYYTVDLTAPTQALVVATGALQQADASSDKVTRYRFSSGPAREFYLVMSPDFKVITRQVGETRLNSYYLPGNAAAAERAIGVASRSLEAFNERFGLYPYTELDVVDAPMRNALGVEFPGVFLIGDQLYDNPSNPSFDVAVAHETAHQWWYNLVGNDVFAEPWLDESLTTYSSSLYYEDAVGEQAAEGLVSYWQDRYEKLVEDGKDDVVTAPLDYFEALGDPAVYGTVVYTKGALFFHALRQEIGDAAFFQALQKYLDAYRFKIATGEHLLDIFEETAGRQLDDFYNSWLYTTR
jgi:hypothetical protein